MSVIAFDTLSYARKLVAAGVEPKQAEAMAEAQKEAFDQMVDARQLATKLDIARLEKQITEAILQSQRYTTNLLLTLSAIIIAAIGIAVAILFNPGPG